MIYSFEVTNLNTIQIYRFSQYIKQKQRLPIIGELQKRVLIYLFEHQLINDISEISVKVNPECDIISMKIIGSQDKFFVKIKAFK